MHTYNTAMEKIDREQTILGRPAKISKVQILQDVEQYPDDYISERAERFGVISTHAVFNALHAAGISRKKRR